MKFWGDRDSLLYSGAPAEPPYLGKYSKRIKPGKLGCHVTGVRPYIKLYCLIIKLYTGQTGDPLFCQMVKAIKLQFLVSFLWRSSEYSEKN